MQPKDTAGLDDFITATKSKGASDEFLAAFLTRRGWSADEVYAALGRYWEQVTGIALPQPGDIGESSRDAFLYLLVFATLATWATALGGMIFQFINHWLPDPVSRNVVFDLRSTITWQMARIAVAFPIYLLVTRLTFRESMSHPERLQSGVRKWLTYIALLGTAGAMICDLIWFLDYLLTGEITPRFMLKAATVMVISGGIFAYYLATLRWNRSTNASRARSRTLIFAGASALAVITTFCIGLAVAGTPPQQRQVEADRKRVEDLHALALAINAWHYQAPVAHPNAPIPATLTDLIRARRINASQVSDPETHAVYEYRPKSGNQYELCANFSSNDITASSGTYRSGYWRHGKGKTCFELDASEMVPW